MSKIHEVRALKIDEDYLYLVIDEQTYRIRWADTSPKLAKATMTQRKYFEISPAGYGLHWPWLDEDLAITPLLQYAEKVAAVNQVVEISA